MATTIFALEERRTDVFSSIVMQTVLSSRKFIVMKEKNRWVVLVRHQFFVKRVAVTEMDDLRNVTKAPS